MIVKTIDLSPSLQEYLEAILLISRKKKNVRVKDLVDYLQVKSASVTGALKRLVQMELIEHEHYGYIELTVAGQESAGSIYEKHQTLFSFLTDFLMISQDVAEKDACLLEHHISQETFEKFLAFIQFLEKNKNKSILDLKKMRTEIAKTIRKRKG